jgi:tetratricopeptide (TPR) repeat protein
LARVPDEPAGEAPDFAGADGFAALKGTVIEPFGKFEPWDLFAVQRHLYNCEMALGRYEDALSVAAALPGRLEEFVLQQVDCLLAMGRRPEALALLERNLDLDGWRGTLRRRLTELGGRPLRSVN